jgi:hypothetical protein
LHQTHALSCPHRLVLSPHPAMDLASHHGKQVDLG